MARFQLAAEIKSSFSRSSLRSSLWYTRMTSSSLGRAARIIFSLCRNSSARAVSQMRKRISESKTTLAMREFALSSAEKRMFVSR